MLIMVDHDPSAHSPRPLDIATLEHYNENRDTLDQAYFKLKNIYGLNGDLSILAHSLPEYMYRKYAFSHNLPEGEGMDYYKKMEGVYIANTTKYIREAIGILKDEHGVDILGSKQPISGREQYTSVLQSLIETTGNAAPGTEIPDEQAVYAFAVDMVHMAAGTKDAYRAGVINTQKQLRVPGLTQSVQAVLFAQESFYKHAVKNLNGSRYDARKDFREMCDDNVTALLDLFDEVAQGVGVEPEAGSDGSRVAMEILRSKKQELDITVFPAGTELRDIAQMIVDESSEYSKAHIDLERVAVLENVRQWFGADRSYLMRGKSTGKGMKDENGMLISEDYIGLIMQHHDQDGAVAREDCLAISPIARKHAGYLVRQDASAGISWREVLSLSKNDALEYFNARRLRFDPVAGEDTYEAYTQKVKALLTCSSEEFGREYVLKRGKGGEYRTVPRGKAVAAQSIQAALLLGEH